MSQGRVFWLALAGVVLLIGLLIGISIVRNGSREDCRPGRAGEMHLFFEEGEDPRSKADLLFALREDFPSVFLGFVYGDLDPAILEIAEGVDVRILQEARARAEQSEHLLRVEIEPCPGMGW